MKLYTEEQVRKAMIKSLGYSDDVIGFYPDVEILKSLTPIELPSNEEIEDYAKEFVLSHDFSALTNPNHLANRCFQLGAKWMKEQILGKEDKTFKKKSQWTEVDNMTRRLK